MSEIYRFIHAEKANYTDVLLCKVMKTPAPRTTSEWLEPRPTRRGSGPMRPWRIRSR